MPNYETSFHNATRTLKQRLEAIEAALEARELRRAAKLQRKILRSSGTVLCALAKTRSDRTYRHWTRIERPSDGELLSMSETLNMFEQTHHNVTIHSEPKVDGYREICAFNFQDTALQRVAKIALLPFAKQEILDWQYGGRGGRNRAASDLKNEMDGGQYSWRVSADIQSFYPSLSHQDLVRKLNLPRRVIESHVLSSAYRGRMVVGGNMRSPSNVLHGEQEVRDRCGVLQGSACSPLVADVFLSERLRQVARGHSLDCRAFCYVDDFVFLLKSYDDAQCLIKALLDVFTDAPARPLTFKYLEAKPLNQEFRFLGYDFIPQSGGVAVDIPLDKVAGQENHVMELAKGRRQSRGVRSGRVNDNPIDAALKSARGWANSHSVSPQAEVIGRGWHSALEAVQRGTGVDQAFEEYAWQPLM